MASNDGRIDQRYFWGAVVLLGVILGYMLGTGQFSGIGSSEPDEQEYNQPISPEP